MTLLERAHSTSQKLSIQNIIVEIAVMKHRQAWIKDSGVSKQTKSAQLICRSWQQAVEDKYCDRFRRE
jgi:hypothetical protein